MPDLRLQRVLSGWAKSGRVQRLLVALVIFCLLYCVAFLAVIHFAGQVDSAAPADIIIALGAGLLHDGRPGPPLIRRSLHAAGLWHAGVAPLVLCAGGQTERQLRAEAEACRDLLLDAGLPAAAILLESQSRSTEENAIFSKPILEARGLERVLLVSDSYHMLRAGMLFRAQGVDALASPVPRERIRDPLNYLYSLLRELAAFHWQLFKAIFGLPMTRPRGL